MAGRILTGKPLLRNEIRIVAQIFEHSLDYHNHQASCVSKYLQDLRTLLGFSFTATLADGNLLYLSQAHLTRFLDAQAYFEIKEEAKHHMACAVAELVYLATLCFYKLEFPFYYDNFLALLRQMLTQVSGLGREQEIECILNHLSRG